MDKRRKKFFNREIILNKLLTASEISAEILLGLVVEAANIAKAMSMSPAQAQRFLRKSNSSHVKIDLKSKVAFWKLLSKLKKDNLILKNKTDKIVLTKKGKKYLQLKDKKLSRKKRYTFNDFTGTEIIIFIFDIPEKERVKRDWLRFQLEKFNFRVLQKSVWWGTITLPKEFIKDLRKYKIIDYVHIFSVKKEGTISNLLNR